jgi:shikimate dehydrogenase
MKDDDPMPFDLDRIAATTFVGEVVMKAEYTPLLRAAKDKGCALQVGTDMLFEMIPAYLEFFGNGAASPDELRAVSQIKYS